MSKSTGVSSTSPPVMNTSLTTTPNVTPFKLKERSTPPIAPKSTPASSPSASPSPLSGTSRQPTARKRAWGQTNGASTASEKLDTPTAKKAAIGFPNSSKPISATPPSNNAPTKNVIPAPLAGQKLPQSIPKAISPVTKLSDGFKNSAKLHPSKLRRILPVNKSGEGQSGLSFPPVTTPTIVPSTQSANAPISKVSSHILKLQVDKSKLKTLLEQRPSHGSVASQSGDLLTPMQIDSPVVSQPKVAPPKSPDTSGNASLLVKLPTPSQRAPTSVCSPGLSRGIQAVLLAYTHQKQDNPEANQESTSTVQDKVQPLQPAREASKSPIQKPQEIQAPVQTKPPSSSPTLSKSGSGMSKSPGISTTDTTTSQLQTLIPSTTQIANRIHSPLAARAPIPPVSPNPSSPLFPRLALPTPPKLVVQLSPEFPSPDRSPSPQSQPDAVQNTDVTVNGNANPSSPSTSTLIQASHGTQTITDADLSLVATPTQPPATNSVQSTVTDTRHGLLTPPLRSGELPVNPHDALVMSTGLPQLSFAKIS